LGLMILRVVVVMLASLAANCFPEAVAGEVSQAADSDTVAVILFPGGRTIDCTQEPAPGEDRATTTTRRFASFTVDQCVWTVSADETDLYKPAALFRSGSKGSCSFEEAKVPPTFKLSRSAYSDYLTGKGVEDLVLEADEIADIESSEFRYQVLSGRMPQSFSPEMPRYRAHVWLWSLGDAMVMLACNGPVESVDKESAVIRSLGASLRIIGQVL
jgi:hypothetical protein